MSVYSQFSILPFDKKSHEFFIDESSGTTDIFNESNSKGIYETMKKDSAMFIKKAEARKLQDALNMAIEGYGEEYEKLINKIINQLDSELPKLLMDAGLARQYRGTIKLNSLNSLSAEQQAQLQKISRDLFGDKTTNDTVKDSIMRINGSLSKIRGDIFENFLSVILNNSAEIIDNLFSVGVEEIESYLVNNMSKYSKGNIKAVNKTNSSTKVTGNVLKDSILATIDGETISVSSSQGKTDVAIQGLNGDFLGISAKNYTGSRKVTLLSGANVVGLISQWPTDNHTKNLALNGLSAVSLSASQYDLMKQIFLIQGLMGTNNESILSQLFIINRNTVRKPILIFSVYDLLFGDTNFEGEFSEISPISDLPRDLSEFMEFINTTKITIKTKLKLAKLTQLA